MKFKGLLFAVAALAASPALGQEINFVGPGMGSWHDGSNWAGGSAPTAINDVVVSDSGSGRVAQILAANPDVTINNLRFRFSNIVDIAGSKTLNVNGTLSINNGSGISGGGTLNVGGASTIGSGAFSVGTANFNGALTVNAGPLNITGNALNTNAGLDWTASGDLLLDSVAWTNGAGSNVTRSAPMGATNLQLNNSTTVTNNGTFSFSGGTATAFNLNSGSSFSNEVGGRFELSGHSMNVAGGTFTNAGTVSVDGANTLTFANYADNGGIVELTNGGVVDFGGDLTVTAGKVGGTGQVNENLTLVGGTIEPGNSPGTLTINGNLTLDGGATLVLELVDTGSFDILNVTGDVNLTDAAISVDASGLTANVGDTFAFLTSGGTTSGMFTNPMTFTSGIYEFELSHSAGGASLEVISAVPEPSSLALLGVAGVGAVLRRRRR